MAKSNSEGKTKHRNRDDRARAPGTADHWTPEAVALLGQASDRAIAARLGRTHYSVKKKRTSLNIADYEAWPSELIAVLGTATDADIAKEFGKTRANVTMKRLSLNIQPFTTANSKPAILPPAIVELLGKIPDHQIASLTGYAQATIWRYRERLGIDALRDRKSVV